MRAALALCLLGVVVEVMQGSLTTYRSMPAASLGYVFLPAALGTVITSLPVAPLGARLAHRVDGTTLKRIFAGFLATMAVLLATT